LIYKGKDLKWIIPYIYLTTSENQEVFIVSPWIDVNVLLSLPWIDNNYTITLLDLVLQYKSKRNIESHFIFSDSDTDNKLNQKSSYLLRREGIGSKGLKNLHMKAVAGQRLLYHGSANITYSGMNLNSELVTLERISNQTLTIRNLLGDAFVGISKD
jgi:hypothetical protein